MLSDLQKKKGKVDRIRESERERYNNEKIFLNPRSGIEQTIKDLYDDYQSNINCNTRSVDVVLDLYLNIRNLRHDIWVDLLNAIGTTRDTIFGDIRVEDFLKKTFPKYNYNTECNYKKTPDILLLAHNDYVLLGDVAVTKSTQAANRTKYFKYYDIEKDLIANNIKVKHTNLIIDEALYNYRSELQKFVELEVIRIDDVTIKRATEYHKTCQIIMDNLLKQCISPREFNERLSLIDSLAPNIEDIVLDDYILKKHKMLTPEVTLSEDQIIEMIKAETERNMDYFDNDISESIAAINGLLSPDTTNKELTTPKSVLKVCSNQTSVEPSTGYNLVKAYNKDLSFGDDCDVKDFILDIMPSITQVEIMERIYDDKENGRKAQPNDKMKGVHGPFQYKRSRNNNHNITTKINDQLTMGKKKKNVKRAPQMVNPDMFESCIIDLNKHIEYYGNPSRKDPFLDDGWDSKTNFETENSKVERNIYDYVRSTNGAQLGHSLSNLYHRITHLKTGLSNYDNIYIPPNGSFICIIPKEHAPICSSRCDLPMIFLTRIDKDEANDVKEMIISGLEYEYRCEGLNYTYYVSKLCRLNVDKIAHWSQLGYKLVASGSYLLSTCSELRSSKIQVIGTLTLLMLDGHQKTSEYLDLLKYISFMPFSDISRLSKLILDKCDLLIKTKLDIWLLSRMRDFITELSKIDKLNAIKPKLQLFNSSVTRDSLGMSLNLPSFINPLVRHSNISDFIEEISMMFIIRPKQLYGSQFMDKAIHNIVDWTIEYAEEKRKYGGWATNGYSETSFPFDSKFCYSKDVIYHAQQYVKEKICPDVRKISRSLNKNPPDSYMHYNCSLRGCVKSKAYRKNINDLNTTSLDQCLKYYRDVGYIDNLCTVQSVATSFLKSEEPMEFNMSEKEQRGGGRPIATPTLGAKACLMMIEKPEQAIGENMGNNIIVAGKHKLKAQSDAYKNLLSVGAIKGYKEIYQLTEDQTKFSENDNYRKYYHYIANNHLLPPNIKMFQSFCLSKLTNREHLVKRMPKTLDAEPKYDQYRNNGRNGYVTDIGWPQGMLNMISTSVHSLADYWITHAYNKAYPESTVETSGLVHSDDSWVAVACNDLSTFKKFTIFRTFAKRLFCLKLNDKKVWGSRYLGELVSNYNINGNVHLSVAKTLSNSFGNLLYQNWTMDVHTQISSIQQAYRNGANIPTLIMLSTILRQQMMDCYQVSGYHKSNIHDLPIELGGYPDTSAFELGVTGVSSHYKKILEMVKSRPTANISSIILKTLRLSVMAMYDNERIDSTVDRLFKSKTDLLKKFSGREELNEIDYQSIAIPSRGDVFSCIRQIMPKSKKVTSTMNEINALPFESDGIELIVTRPNNLSTSLGNLKTQSSTLLFDLASQKYSQSTRRLAVSQAIQSSGHVVRVGKCPPMTINEMLYFIDRCDVIPLSPEMLEVALNDESDLSSLCEACVYRADYDLSNRDKRKIINRQPEDQDKFRTICKLKNVLLYIIDTNNKTTYLNKYGTLDEPMDILRTDADLIIKRFKIYFQFYKTKYACNLIMQQYLTRQKAKLWMQAYLNTDSLVSFICDLYGKSISSITNYRVSLTLGTVGNQRDEEDIINSLYTVSVLNEIYHNKFTPVKIKGKYVDTILKEIDYTKLSNEAYLKYGVLSKIYLENDNHLFEYDIRKMYDQIYTKPQSYVDGRWTGDFECLCRYGKTILKITGEPENVSIEVNAVNISDILNCMHLFVKQNFKYYAYKFPANWGCSAFWDTKFKFSELYLSSYSRVVTMVSQRPGISSVSLTINKNLKMPLTYNILAADSFILSENLRLVKKVVNGRTIKVGNIPQTMICPYTTSIELIPDMLDGFDNNFLLHSRTITNLCTNRIFNCTKSDVIKLLTDREPPINGEGLINFYCNLINSFGDLNIAIENANIDEPIIQEEITITGQSTRSYFEEHITASPEDLSYIEANYVYDDEIRTGSIYKHINITRALCSVISSAYGVVDINSVISLLIHDKELATVMVSDLDSKIDDVNMKIECCRDAADYMEVDVAVNCFIIGNKLDTELGFVDVDMRSISNMRHLTPTPNNYKIFRKLKTALMENIHSITDDDIDPVNVLMTRIKK